MIPRILFENLVNRLFKGKAIIILGARQTGKTSLVRRLMAECPEVSVFLNADRLEVRRQLTDASTATLVRLCGNARLVVIDEAQRV